MGRRRQRTRWTVVDQIVASQGGDQLATLDDHHKLKRELEPRFLDANNAFLVNEPDTTSSRARQSCFQTLKMDPHQNTVVYQPRSGRTGGGWQGSGGNGGGKKILQRHDMESQSWRRPALTSVKPSSQQVVEAPSNSAGEESLSSTTDSSSTSSSLGSDMSLGDVRNPSRHTSSTSDSLLFSDSVGPISAGEAAVHPCSEELPYYDGPQFSVPDSQCLPQMNPHRYAYNEDQSSRLETCCQRNRGYEEETGGPVPAGFTKIRSKNLDVLFKRDYYSQMYHRPPTGFSTSSVIGGGVGGDEDEDRQQTDFVDQTFDEDAEKKSNDILDDQPLANGLAKDHARLSSCRLSLDAPPFVPAASRGYQLYLYSPASNTMIPYCELQRQNKETVDQRQAGSPLAPVTSTTTTTTTSSAISKTSTSVSTTVESSSDCGGSQSTTVEEECQTCSPIPASDADIVEMNPIVCTPIATTVQPTFYSYADNCCPPYRPAQSTTNYGYQSYALPNEEIVYSSAPPLGEHVFPPYVYGANSCNFATYCMPVQPPGPEYMANNVIPSERVVGRSDVSRDVSGKENNNNCDNRRNFAEVVVSNVGGNKGQGSGQDIIPGLILGSCSSSREEVASGAGGSSRKLSSSVSGSAAGSAVVSRRRRRNVASKKISMPEIGTALSADQQSTDKVAEADHGLIPTEDATPASIDHIISSTNDSCQPNESEWEVSAGRRKGKRNRFATPKASFESSPPSPAHVATDLTTEKEVSAKSVGDGREQIEEISAKHNTDVEHGAAIEDVAGDDVVTELVDSDLSPVEVVVEAAEVVSEDLSAAAAVSQQSTRLIVQPNVAPKAKKTTKKGQNKGGKQVDQSSKNCAELTAYNIQPSQKRQATKPHATRPSSPASPAHRVTYLDRPSSHRVLVRDGFLDLADWRRSVAGRFSQHPSSKTTSSLDSSSGQSVGVSGECLNSQSVMQWILDENKSSASKTEERSVQYRSQMSAVDRLIVSSVGHGLIVGPIHVDRVGNNYSTGSFNRYIPPDRTDEVPLELRTVPEDQDDSIDESCQDGGQLVKSN